ncbi:hypothetical protein BDN72DRAFT_893319 [Pluteus cervinus]|uniref:Uncharacterized protein n=1 Tax=Pluteus cervinus TaxID=181527 RepID=A0ACD3B8X5_9AGAR|nr:hypothetical protein BDN72DRAFT_893319 [Pluteus cervinus]
MPDEEPGRSSLGHDVQKPKDERIPSTESPKPTPTENKQTKTEKNNAQRPRSKSIIGMITAKFRSRSPSPAPPTPTLSAAAKNARDAALRERGLLPPLRPNKDLSQQEYEQDKHIPVVRPPSEDSTSSSDNEPSAADLIKKQWESMNKSLTIETEQRHRLSSFKFGGQPIDVGSGSGSEQLLTPVVEVDTPLPSPILKAHSQLSSKPSTPEDDEAPSLPTLELQAKEPTHDKEGSDLEPSTSTSAVHHHPHLIPLPSSPLPSLHELPLVEDETKLAAPPPPSASSSSSSSALSGAAGAPSPLEIPLPPSPVPTPKSSHNKLRATAIAAAATTHLTPLSVPTLSISPPGSPSLTAVAVAVDPIDNDNDIANDTHIDLDTEDTSPADTPLPPTSPIAKSPTGTMATGSSSNWRRRGSRSRSRGHTHEGSVDSDEVLLTPSLDHSSQTMTSSELSTSEGLGVGGLGVGVGVGAGGLGGTGRSLKIKPATNENSIPMIVESPVDEDVIMDDLIPEVEEPSDGLKTGPLPLPTPTPTSSDSPTPATAAGGTSSEIAPPVVTVVEDDRTVKRGLTAPPIVEKKMRRFSSFSPFSRRGHTTDVVNTSTASSSLGVNATATLQIPTTGTTQQQSNLTGTTQQQPPNLTATQQPATVTKKLTIAKSFNSLRNSVVGTLSRPAKKGNGGLRVNIVAANGGMGAGANANSNLNSNSNPNPNSTSNGDGNGGGNPNSDGDDFFDASHLPASPTRIPLPASPTPSRSMIFGRTNTNTNSSLLGHSNGGGGALSPSSRSIFGDSSGRSLFGGGRSKSPEPQSPTRTTIVRQPLSPPIYNRGSLLLEIGGIEDEESRRVTELAFFG